MAEDQEFRLAKSIDGVEVTTDQLTREQAWSFVHAAQHMLNHLRHEFELPGWIERCSACLDPIPAAWFHGQGALCGRCEEEFKKIEVESGADWSKKRVEFVHAKRRKVQEREALSPLPDDQLADEMAKNALAALAEDATEIRSDTDRIDQIENYGLAVEHKGRFLPDGSVSAAWHPLLSGPDDPEWDNLRDALDATAPSESDLSRDAKKIIGPPEKDDMSDTPYSDNLVLACLFSQMEQVEVEDGKLRVRGDLIYPPVVAASVEADFDIEVDCESGHFAALVAGPLKKDSHPFKYRMTMNDEEAEDVLRERDMSGI